MNQPILVEVDSRDEAMLAQIGELRIRAWATVIPEAAQLTHWTDPGDLQSRHWAFLEDGQPIAAARLSVHNLVHEIPDKELLQELFPAPLPSPIASFNRLVVDPIARMRGLSRELDLVRLHAAEEMGCKTAVVATLSGGHRIRQLQSFGFVVVGDAGSWRKGPFAFCDMPSVIMMRHFPATFCDNPRPIAAF